MEAKGPDAAGALACSEASSCLSSLPASMLGPVASCLRSAAGFRKQGRLGPPPAAPGCALASSFPCSVQQTAFMMLHDRPCCMTGHAAQVMQESLYLLMMQLASNATCRKAMLWVHGLRACQELFTTSRSKLHQHLMRSFHAQVPAIQELRMSKGSCPCKRRASNGWTSDR